MRTLGIILAIAASLPCVAADIAITFDDLPAQRMAHAEALTPDLLKHFTKRRLPVVAFVNGDKLLVDGKVDPARVALLDRWMEAGVELGNHTYSHRSLHRIPVEEYEKDIVAGEAHLIDVIRRHKGKLRYFRHPFLQTGRSAEIRDRVTKFVEARGYKVAPVTIDNSEWIFASAYDRAPDEETKKKLVTAYLDYMEAKVEYHVDEAVRLFGRPIRHVLLVHSNTLNAVAFGQLADRLKKRGHRFITLEAALKDPAYRTKDEFFGGAGISWLDRWALTRGVPKSFFANEPRTPQWVQDVAGVEE